MSRRVGICFSIFQILFFIQKYIFHFRKQCLCTYKDSLLVGWHCPQSPENLVSLGATHRQVDAKCNLRKTQKRGEPHPAIRIEFPSKLQSLFFLFLFFCLLLLLLFFKKLIHIVLCSLIIFHLLPCLAVLGIGLFLLLKNLLIFLIEFPD